MECSLPGSSVHGHSPGKNTGVGCHAPLQGIFPTQGSNPGLLHYKWIFSHLSHQGSPLTVCELIQKDTIKDAEEHQDGRDAQGKVCGKELSLNIPLP